MRTLITCCDSHIFRSFFRTFSDSFSNPVIEGTFAFYPIMLEIGSMDLDNLLNNQKSKQVSKNIKTYNEIQGRLKFYFGCIKTTKSAQLAHFSHIFFKEGVMEINST